MGPQSRPASETFAEVMSNVADSSTNQAPRSYMPVPRLKIAGPTVRIAGATGEMPEPRWNDYIWNESIFKGKIEMKLDLIYGLINFDTDVSDIFM